MSSSYRRRASRQNAVNLKDNIVFSDFGQLIVNESSRQKDLITEVVVTSDSQTEAKSPSNQNKHLQKNIPNIDELELYDKHSGKDNIRKELWPSPFYFFFRRQNKTVAYAEREEEINRDIETGNANQSS